VLHLHIEICANPSNLRYLRAFQEQPQSRFIKNNSLFSDSLHLHIEICANPSNLRYLRAFQEQPQSPVYKKQRFIC
ncbi:MAG: hypothetical protein LBG92_05180, partial [Prevotellaceae bacterium]|nr:hypothetical protein [Prevotellaceae bacterium]